LSNFFERGIIDNRDKMLISIGISLCENNVQKIFKLKPVFAETFNFTDFFIAEV